MKYFALILCLIASLAHAEYVDLSKGKVLARGICEIATKSYPCVAVELDGKKYLVLVDRKGKTYQFIVNDDGTVEVIYIRDSI